MKAIIVAKDTPLEVVLGLVETEITTKKSFYILVSFATELSSAARKQVVESIKRYFDVFVILQTDLHTDKPSIEEYFAYGVHGLYFGRKAYTDAELELVGFARELFTPSWVFSGTDSELRLPFLDKGSADYSLAAKIKRKMLLETLNLRQKLMIKNVEDSYLSSGL